MDYTKKACRREVKERLAKMTDALRTDASSSICHSIHKLEEWQEARSVLLFHPMKSEPDITPLLGTRDKQLFLPRMIDDCNLEIVPYSGAESLAQGKFGIFEPSESNAVALDEIDLVLVPAVAIDRNGHRLGHGKGYYDRLLAGFRKTTIGVVFASQIFENIPFEQHDIALSYIVTENETIKI